jgi:polysaccharide export outer membrane protein
MQPRPRSAPPTADPLSIVRPAPASCFRLAPRRLSGRLRPTAGTRVGRRSRLPCGRTALLTALTLSAVTTVRAQLPDSTTTAGDARIGLGDRIVLKVWREPTWSDAFPVDPAGDVVLPRIGRLHVVGMAAGALKDTVRSRLGVFLREPNVDLIVLRRVAVLGSVRKPDVLYVEPVTTLQGVIAQAGGIDEEGDPNRIEILRDGQRIRLGRWSMVSTSADVRSGDQVVVGKRSWISRNALAAVSSFAVAVSVLVTTLRR